MSDNSGNVAILFTFALLPMIGIVGLGVDVSRAHAAKTVLDASADAAALGAVTEALATLQTYGQGSSGTATAIYAGTLAGQSMFAINAAHVGNTIVGGPPTPAISIARNGQTLTATVTYASASPNVFGPMFGSRSISLNGSATSSLSIPKYMNISVAIDISQSMGLASTSAYMTQLAGLTGGCAFGCHVTTGGQSQSNEVTAHNANIPLRIDIIRTATQSMIQTAANLNTGVPLIQFGIYSMQYNLTTIASMSSNYTSLMASANAIDLGPNNSSGVGDTAYSSSMPTLSNQTAASGDGSTSSAAQQFVFIMSDGVQDVYGNCTDGHCTKAFDPSYCSALKAKGVTVGVIYTTYLPIPGEQTYQDLVQPFASQIGPNMQSCASPGWYYQATDATDIQAAVKQLFSQAIGRGALTQ